MPTLQEWADARLALLEAKHLARSPVETEALPGVRVRRGGRELISFSGNDYLGLSHHARVVEAARAALETFGVGAGASRLVTGEHPVYAALEARLARMKGAEAACVFGSGYLANLGVIPALVGAGDLILADKLVHACMLDGARLSGATLMRFAHNSVEHCAELLAAHRGEHQQCLILTETVFSMDGDRAPIRALHALAEQHDAWLMTDDAHGLGITDSVPAHLSMGTLSKAAGAYGGYVCGPRAVIALLKSTARSLVFSTALPPSVVAAAEAALQVMEEEPGLRERALAHARLFTTLLARAPAESAIVPVLLGEETRALEASAALLDAGFLVAAIRPPTVPPGTARLRFTFSALHTEQEVRALAEVCIRGGYI